MTFLVLIIVCILVCMNTMCTYELWIMNYIHMYIQCMFRAFWRNICPLLHNACVLLHNVHLLLHNACVLLRNVHLLLHNACVLLHKVHLLYIILHNVLCVCPLYKHSSRLHTTMYTAQTPIGHWRAKGWDWGPHQHIHSHWTSSAE